jgi:hypothetical protein
MFDSWCVCTVYAGRLVVLGGLRPVSEHRPAAVLLNDIMALPRTALTPCQCHSGATSSNIVPLQSVHRPPRKCHCPCADDTYHGLARVLARGLNGGPHAARGLFLIAARIPLLEGNSRRHCACDELAMSSAWGGHERTSRRPTEAPEHVGGAG